MFTFNPGRERGREREGRGSVGEEEEEQSGDGGGVDNEINNKRAGPSDKLLFILL